MPRVLTMGKIAVKVTTSAGWQVRLVRCGYFHISARMSAHGGSSEALQRCWKPSWNYSFHCHGSARHELVHQPSHWDDEDGYACCSSCSRFSTAIPVVHHILRISIFRNSRLLWPPYQIPSCNLICASTCNVRKSLVLFSRPSARQLLPAADPKRHPSNFASNTNAGCLFGRRD